MTVASPAKIRHAVSDSLTDSGGTISFLSSGSYTLTATAVNSAGRETAFSQTVTVYFMIDVSFELPETSHTDKTVTIVESADFGNQCIAWSVTKDGAAADDDDYWYQVYAGPQTMQFDYSVLKEKRKKLGFTQQQVADAVETTVRTYQKWESGETTPDGHFLIRLLNWLDIPDIQNAIEYTTVQT